jgi:hypothetical protein
MPLVGEDLVSSRARSASAAGGRPTRTIPVSMNVAAFRLLDAFVKEDTFLVSDGQPGCDPYLPSPAPASKLLPAPRIHAATRKESHMPHSHHRITRPLAIRTVTLMSGHLNKSCKASTNTPRTYSFFPTRKLRNHAEIADKLIKSGPDSPFVDFPWLAMLQTASR